MLCPRCGGFNDEKQKFCHTCGMTLEASSAIAAAGSPRSKLESIVMLLGVLWIALALWSIAGLLGTYTIYRRIGFYSLAALLFPILQNGTLLILKGIVIYALMTYRSSGRVVAIVVSIFNLFMIAMGQVSVLYASRAYTHRWIGYTPFRLAGILAAAAIYIYTLIVLAPAASGIAWSEIVARKRSQNP